MNYAEISKEIISHLYKSYESLKNSPLDQAIIALANLRVSQINGCKYCCGLHTLEAKRLGIANEKLAEIADWKNSTHFNHKEKLSLAWTEALTKFTDERDHIKRDLFEIFSEREIVDLTAAISIMNGLNRLAVGLRG
jgi:AhpD family alkylhydroperoxidase